MRMATGDGEDRPAEEIARGRWLELPRDSEAPFYQSRVPDFRSPQATFTEIRGRVSELLAEVPSWHPRWTAVVSAEQIQRWHRRIFDTTFPGDAGRLRKPGEPDTDYGVLLLDAPADEWRWTRVPAAPASEVPALLDAACDRFEQVVPKEHEPTTDQAAGAAADLFVDVLKVHPFVDGNMRVAVVALATALRRLRQRPVAIYPNDLEFAVGLSYALRSTEDASREPMRNLVAQRLDHR